MNIPFFTKARNWKRFVGRTIHAIAGKLSRLVDDGRYQDRQLRILADEQRKLSDRLDAKSGLIEEIRTAVILDEASLDTLSEVSKKHDAALELLIADQVANSKIGITTKGDLEAIKEDLPAHPDKPLTGPIPDGGKNFTATLVSKDDPKPKIKKVSLARKIIDWLVRMGTDWSLQSEIKEQLLGDDAVKSGGGHFSRTMNLLGQQDLVEFDDYTDAVRLTKLGQAQAQLVWHDMREYNALITSDE